jgi:hypothetical protein
VPRSRLMGLLQLDWSIDVRVGTRRRPPRLKAPVHADSKRALGPRKAPPRCRSRGRRKEANRLIEGVCSEVYIRASRDLGKTWTDAQRVSTKPSCPRSPSNTVTRAYGKPNAIDRRWMEGGDYHGLVVGEQGRFHAAWSDSSTGVFQMHFATIEVTGPAPLSPERPSAVR